MSEWKECKLGDVAIVRGGKRLPKGKMLTALPTNHPYIRIADFSGHKILFDGIQYVDDEIQKSIARYTVEAGDLVISIVGTLGLCAIIPKELDKANLTENCAKIHIKGDNVEKLFLYYHLISTEIQDTIVGFDVGSTQPKLPLYNVQNINLLLPPLPEQRAIAGVLSSLDDKIDLLHRQNKTLEGMAEALWRKMFVEETDPNWKKGKLGDIAEINPPRSIIKGAIAIYIDMSNMPTNGPFPTGWIQREFTSGMKFKNDDTIIARITPCLENGKTAYVNFLNDAEIGWGSTEYIVLSPKSGYCPEWFYFLARSEDFRDFAIQNMTGTSGRQRVSGESIAQYEIAIPSINNSEQFGEFAGPAMKHIKHNSFQIRTLSRLRDTLLPKLMSGEVRVKV